MLTGIPQTDLWSLNGGVLNYFPLILRQTLSLLTLQGSGTNKKPNKIPEKSKTLSSKQLELYWNQMSPRVTNFGIRQFIVHLLARCFLRRPRTIIVAASAVWFTAFANATSQKYTHFAKIKYLNNFIRNFKIYYTFQSEIREGGKKLFVSSQHSGRMSY